MSSPARLAGFALAGLIAAVCSCVLPQVQFAQSHDKALQFIGIFLGVTISIYLWLFERQRSLWRALVFTAASTCAYYVAMMLGLMSMGALRWLRLPVPGVNREEVPLMIVGGFIGAAILYLAFTLLYCRGIRAATFFAGWPLTALLGSVLAIVGYAIGSNLAGAKGDQQIYALYLVWQPAMAATLGYLSIRTETQLRRAHVHSTQS